MPGITRPVLRYDQPALRRPAVPVESFDAELRWLVEDLFATMYAYGGVGVAANQVGDSRRVFVFDCPDTVVGRLVGHIVNPRWVPLTPAPAQVSHREGCLSLPNVIADVTRPEVAALVGVDISGATVGVEGVGIGARCLHHEMEHLDGRMYFDRLPDTARDELLAQQAEFDLLAH